MKLDEAIEELETINHDGFTITRHTEYEALNLGIEALKARKIWQDEEGFDPAEALPGETDETEEERPPQG